MRLARLLHSLLAILAHQRRNRRIIRQIRRGRERRDRTTRRRAARRRATTRRQTLLLAIRPVRLHQLTLKRLQLHATRNNPLYLIAHLI